MTYARRLGLGLFLTLALVVAGASAQAAVKYVDDSNTGVEDGTAAHPYNTIQEGVNAAANGDAVQVAAGTYTESVSISARADLFIYGMGYNMTVVEHPSKYKFAVTNNCSGITIAGFTVRGGVNGIRIMDSSNVLIEYNYLTEIDQNLIGGAFYIGWSSVRLLGNIVHSCNGGDAGGAARIYDSNIEIIDNMFSDCTAEYAGGGLFISTSPAKTINISSNQFIENTSPRSGAIHIQGVGAQTAVIDHNTLYKCGPNAAMSHGQIYIENYNASSSFRVFNNTIAFGRSPTRPRECYGLYVYSTAPMDVRNNIFASNDYPIVAITGNKITADYNLMYGWNTAHGACYNVTNGANTLTNKNPLFLTDELVDLRLRSGSPCINKGDPALQYNDPDGSRNDMGANVPPFPVKTKFVGSRWATRQSGFWDAQKWISGDFNGDGKKDVAKVFGYTSGGQTLAAIDFHRSTGNSFIFQSQTLALCQFWDTQKWIAGDYNGDGTTDVALVFGYVQNGQQLTGIFVYRSTGNGFVQSATLYNKGSYWDAQKWFSGDFNKDGKADLARLFGYPENGEMKTGVDVYLSTGSDFVYGIAAGNLGRYSEDYRWVSGDFNRDGLADFARIFDSGGGQTGIDTITCTGNGFVFNAQTVGQGGYNSQMKWMTGDFDGDGACDIARAFDSGGGQTGLDVLCSRGYHFTFTRWGTALGGFWDAQKWMAADFSGDGVADATRVFNDSGYATMDVMVAMP